MAMHKPGDTITPASFAVAPELLGRPLASPGQRAAAMAIDLILLAVLVKGSGLFFGIAAAFALWRASARAGIGGRRPRLRTAFRVAAAGVLFIVIASNWGMWTRPLHRLTTDDSDSGSSGDADAPAVTTDSGTEVNANLGDLAAVAEAMSLRRATSSADARKSADKLVRRMKRKGISPDNIRSIEAGLAQGADSGKTALPPAAMQALHEAIAAALPADTAAAASVADRDSLARSYVRALARGDTAPLAQLRPRLGVAFAPDTLRTLGKEIKKLSGENRRLTQRIQQDSIRQTTSTAGVMASMADAGGELVKLMKKAGLGFGWTGLYFTGFVALMRGQTPGKWLMRIRIVRLDGRPMGWWAALERFGGYAASVVTALGGFFQILWDKNRQAMHDKIAETVVVRV